MAMIYISRIACMRAIDWYKSMLLRQVCIPTLVEARDIPCWFSTRNSGKKKSRETSWKASLIQTATTYLQTDYASLHATFLRLWLRNRASHT